jgi:hypothetical protein
VTATSTLLLLRREFLRAAPKPAAVLAAPPIAHQTDAPSP